jgi:hypothetical protein
MGNALPWLLVGLLAAVPAAAADQRMLVADVNKGAGVSADLARTASRVLEGELSRRAPEVEIVTFRALAATLEVAEVAACLGDDEAASCAAEIGSALGVDLIANPHLARIGSQLVITLTIYRTVDASLAGQASQRVDASDEALLLDALRPLATEALATTGLRVVKAGPPASMAVQEPGGPSLLPWAVLAGGGLAAAGLVVTGVAIHGYALTGPAPRYANAEMSADEASAWERDAVFFLGGPFLLYGAGALAAGVAGAGFLLLE